MPRHVRDGKIGGRAGPRLEGLHLDRLDDRVREEVPARSARPARGRRLPERYDGRGVDRGVVSERAPERVLYRDPRALAHRIGHARLVRDRDRDVERTVLDPPYGSRLAHRIGELGHDPPGLPGGQLRLDPVDVPRAHPPHGNPQESADRAGHLVPPRIPLPGPRRDLDPRDQGALRGRTIPASRPGSYAIRFEGVCGNGRGPNVAVEPDPPRWPRPGGRGHRSIACRASLF